MVSAKLKRHLQNVASSSASASESASEQEVIEPKPSEQLTKQLWNFLTKSNNILTENIESFLEEQNDTNAKWSVVTEVSSLPNSILLTNDDNTMTLHNLPKRRHHFNNDNNSNNNHNNINNNNNFKLLRNKIMDNSSNNTSSGTLWLTEMSVPVSNMTTSLSSSSSSSASSSASATATVSASASASLGTQLLLTEATRQSTAATARSVTSTTAASASTLATDNAAFSIFPATNASLILNENVSSLWDFDNTGEDDFDFFYRHSFWMSTLLIFAYIVVFVVGLVGNSFVIAVVLRAPRMRTVTNYFIVNLAVADILVIIFCLPATLMSNIFLPWLLGWLMCKTVPYIQGVSVAASVYSLIAVSLDRFIAIWWPLKQMTKSRARFMILCIWIIALGSTIPWVLFFDLVPASEAFPGADDMYFCQEVWPPGTNGNLYFLVAHLIACYLLPMSLITLCYVLIWIKVSTRSIPGDSKDAQMDRMQQKSKVKVIKMLVAVVILFVLSWLPLYVIFARIKFGGEISLEESKILNTITPFAQWLGSSNSCINPILYAFFNNKYRRGFAAIIKSRSCCGRLRYYDNVAIASSTTSTRKSSHNSRKGPSSPGLRKNNAVSYIYEHNSLRRHASHHTMMAKQDSNLSQRMLLKQDSHGSRQLLIKQESASSDGSRRPLCQQESNGSKMSLSKQDSIVSYIETKRAGQEVFFNQDQQHENFPPYHDRPKFVKQDSIMSTESRRYPFMKQDSVISFADQRRGPLNKQDSIVACSNRGGDNVSHTHHVSILKKTDSMLSGGSYSPSRRNIEIQEQQITFT